MLIAIDIGNTDIVIGGVQGDAIQFDARVATDRIKTSDQYGVEIKNILALFGVKPCDVDDCIISSVVPPVFNSVQTGVRKVIGKPPMVVGPGIKTGLNIQMDTPSQVGSDRIVIAVAALADRLEADPNVKSAMAYSTTLGRQYTAAAFHGDTKNVTISAACTLSDATIEGNLKFSL